MNYLELQIRVNKIVEQVNNYEATLPAEVKDEQELLSLHKYVDLYSLRGIYDWIFSKEDYKKQNSTLANISNACLIWFRKSFISEYPYYLSSGTSSYTALLNDFVVIKLSDLSYLNSSANNYLTDKFTATFVPSYSYSSSCNLALYIPYYVNASAPASTRNAGLNNYTYAIPQDSILTESQICNLTTKLTGCFGASNSRLDLAQLEGILYITGKETYDSNVNKFLPILSKNGYSDTIAEQIIYSNGKNANSGNPDFTKYGTNHHSYRLKYYIPMNTRFGASFTPNNVKVTQFYKDTAKQHIPPEKLPNCIYFEMCFKRRRPGCKALGLDFVPAKSDVVDNDPQGLATRLALAQTKPYYVGRCFFPELEQYYTEDGYYQRKLADKICEETQNMTDEEFIRNYKMNYETYAYATGDEL